MLPVYLLIVALLAVYSVFFLHAEHPKKGTLEWIQTYDKPEWNIPEAEKPFGGYDWLFCLIPAALCAGLWLVLSLLVRLSPAVFTPAAFLLGAVCYLLLRLLGNGVLLSLLSCAMVLTVGNLPPMLLPAAAIVLLVWLWVKDGFGFWSWIYLAAAMLLLAFWMQLFGNILLAVPLLIIVTAVLLRRIRDDECSFWRLPATLGFVVFVFALVLGAIGAFVHWTNSLAFLSDPNYYRWTLAQLTPKFDFALGWRLSQLKWFDFPSAAVLLAGAPLLLHGAIRRHDRTALYLLIWDVAAGIMWFITAAAILPALAAPTLAWLTRRMFARKHRTLAIITLAVPTLWTLALTAYQLIRTF
ncbi:MAG: hypothetical protein IJS31_00685 [Oscillospiraceae bacterium]|nr:hypothetical protein [Oscillospiraceae bacterium]